MTWHYTSAGDKSVVVVPYEGFVSEPAMKYHGPMDSGPSEGAQARSVFSRRTEHDPAPNDLTVAVQRRRALGLQVLDLTDANPTQLDLPVLDPQLLAQPNARHYQPDPFGHPVARQSIADEYARAGVSVDPAHIIVTASTSEAYSYLLKVLADPGDSILVPAPSYPLFDFLARGESVSTQTYPLLFDGHGHHYEAELARSTLHSSATPARALIAVAPNHPTGSLLPFDFVRSMQAEGIPILVDEVFGRFDLDQTAPLTFAPTLLDQGLAFRLCGLSKQLGLPQVKLSWMIVEGDPELVRGALSRLELVADTFLSVAAPVQHALPELFAHGAAFRARVIERTRANLQTLRDALRGTPMSVLRAPAGWTAVLRTVAPEGDEALAVQLLEQAGILLHPGHFFGFGFTSFVVSLLPSPAVFTEAAARLADFARQQEPGSR